MKPLLRIAAMGDIQGYPYPEDAGMRNLERALDVLAPLQPDVVVNVGDINDTGNDADAVRYYKARCDARLGSLPHIACLGNHELGFLRDECKAERTPAAILRDFNSVFGYAPNERVVRRTICGFEFVALSLSRESGYTDAEIAEFGAALDAAEASDPARPVFVVTHYHPKDTVNDSSAEGKCGPLRRLLDRHPRVVSLSGHTHNPLQDPRSIWQGDFTALDVSTLCYGSINLQPPAANQISCLLPFGHEAVGFLVLDVFADRIVVRRFSARTRREIAPDAPWTIPWPHNPARAPYRVDVRRAGEVSPRFAGDPEPTLWYDYGFVYLMFGAAEPADGVFGYRIELEDDGGNATVHFHVSDYYRVPEHRVGRVVFRSPPDALASGRRYRCRIVPVGFFGAKGTPCEWSFAIKADYPLRRDAPNCLPE